MHIISFHPRQPTNEISQGQKYRHGSKELKSNITQTSNKHIHCVHHPKCMFMGMHHSTYASMDGHVNACLWKNKENIKGQTLI